MRKAVWQVLGLFVVTAMLALMAGCGGGSSSGGEGVTVYLTPTVKENPGILLSNSDEQTAKFVYSVKSTTYSNITDVTPSDVIIESSNLKLYEDGNSDPIGDLDFSLSYLITPGGTTDISIELDLSSIINTINQSLEYMNRSSIQFKSVVEFKAKERNSGRRITLDKVDSTFVIKKVVDDQVAVIGNVSGTTIVAVDHNDQDKVISWQQAKKLEDTKYSGNSSTTELKVFMINLLVGTSYKFYLVTDEDTDNPKYFNLTIVGGRNVFKFDKKEDASDSDYTWNLGVVTTSGAVSTPANGSLPETITANDTKYTGDTPQSVKDLFTNKSTP